MQTEVSRGGTYLVVAVGYTLLTVRLLRRRVVGSTGLRRCRGTAPLWVRCCYWSTTSHHLLLGPRLLLLLSLDGGGTSFDQCILNRSDGFSGKHRSWIQRPRHWLFPRLQHLIKLSAYLIVDQAICIHEDCVQITTKEQRVGCSDIFNHRI